MRSATGPGASAPVVSSIPMIPVALALEWMLFAIAALMGLTAWLVYVWAVRDGQFRNVEEAAQRLLDQDARD